jgi:hypothetical protein
MNQELYQDPLSLAHIQQKAVRLYEVVKEESSVLAKGAGFQDVNEDDIVQLLECVSLSLTNEELTELDM